MSVQMINNGSEVVIGVSGKFDFSVHKDFREAYRFHQPTGRYVVDFTRVERIDSAALGMLLLLRDHAGGVSADIIIRNCQPQIQKILEVANFHKLFQIH
ncbi:MAG: STAS domain-containing protein [Magnetococcales bacterium]|nr:STAS domain-containing protein [Magnetococcales bacterium]